MTECDEIKYEVDVWTDGDHPRWSYEDCCASRSAALRVAVTLSRAGKTVRVRRVVSDVIAEYHHDE